MDRLHSFSRVIVDSTQELCEKLVSSYIDKLKETCKNGKFQAWLKQRYKQITRETVRGGKITIQLCIPDAQTLTL